MLENIQKKHLAVAGTIAVAALIVLALLVPRPGMVSARFESGALKPGQNTTLLVDIINVLEGDVATAVVAVRAIDPTSLNASGTQIAYNMARGDSRRFSFPVNILASVEGVYSVEISASLDGRNETVRASIEVRK